MNESIIIFQIIILIMSVVIHELSHGYVAELLGDPTPRLQGRLTLNPFKHLELFGSFIVPVITSFAGFTFGWAKPVQWNPYNVANKRWGELMISIAGPVSNLLIALVFGLILRSFGDSLPASFILISAYVIFINIILAVFNLIPLPPLDGSKVLFSLLPPSMIGVREVLEKYSIFFFLILVFFLWRFVEPIVPYIFKLVTGIVI
ncbi:MAG: site-2 protease family protein [Candidatus Taylorbacteria bacterium]|nr:site-2 protease family protein [Candidatus Taylorbacteria bacterium]